MASEARSAKPAAGQPTTRPTERIEPVSLRQVGRYWWPLAVSWAFMALEAPLVTGVVARLPEPVINLAAYGGVVFPLALIIEAPVIMLLAASTALCRDTPSYLRVRTYMLWAGGGLTLLHIAVAATPLFDAIVIGLMGVAPAVAEPARIGLLIMTPWTWSIAYRRFNQGVLIRFGHSRTVGLGTAVRLVTMTTVLLLGARGGLPGIVAATSAVACGVMAEAAYVGVVVRPVLRGPLADSPPVTPALTWSAFFAFYTPLVLTSLMLLAAQPMASSAMSRMPLAVRSLASWQVAGGLLFLMRSPGVAFNEVVVALFDRPSAPAHLRRFAAYLAAFVTAVGLAVVATPLVDILLEGLLDLGPEVADLVRTALWLGLPLASLTVAQSWYQGRLTSQQRTRGVGEAVALYLAVDAAVLALGVLLSSRVGIVVAVSGMSMAAAAQVVWLRHRAGSSLAQV